MTTANAVRSNPRETSSIGKGLDTYSTTIPIVLGVTGHRDLREQDLPQLKALVSGIFEDLNKKYPLTPLVLLSPLAAGADRFVAQLALEKGLELIVPLSWPHDICPEMVHRTGSRDEFEKLLKRAQHCFDLPLIEGIEPQEICDSEAARDRQYEQLGAYIARHSQILIALWDGEKDEESGTARVISWQQRGELAPYAPKLGRLDELENGPVYHITTPRANNPTSVNEVVLKKLYPTGFSNDAEAASDFDSLWEQIDQFNAVILSNDEKIRSQIPISKEYLLPEDKQDKLSPSMTQLLEFFAQADAASMRFQKHTNLTLWGLFGLVALAVGCFELYAHLLVDYWQLLIAYLMLLMGSVAWYHWSASRHHQAKYLDYRALAEALRVQFFWQLAGLDESVADHYLRNLRSELDWIRQAVRSCNLMTGLHNTREELSNKEMISRLKLVRDHWVIDQYNYFKKSAPKNEKAHHCWANRSRIFFWLAITLAFILLLTHLNTHHLNHLLVVLVFCSVATAALCHEYSEKQAFSVQAKRYDWMRSLFSTANRHLEKLIETRKAEEAQQLIKELGTEALQENADWLLQRRQRPVKPPTV